MLDARRQRLLPLMEPRQMDLIGARRFRFVQFSSVLETSQLQIVASDTVRFSGGSSFHRMMPALAKNPVLGKQLDAIYLEEYLSDGVRPPHPTFPKALTLLAFFHGKA